MEVHEDDNPRPAKRLRLVSQPSSPLPTLTPPTPIRTPRETHSAPSPLPPVHVLLALPSLLLHPPTHRDYPYSLCLSLLALRRCLAFGNLEPELECRAWTATAELGIQVIKSGFCASEWAVGVENEAERAVTKGLLIAQKHPSLRLYKPHLTLLSATLSQLTRQPQKYTHSILRKLVSSGTTTDPPHVTYAAHLALIASYTSSTLASVSDTAKCLSTIQDLRSLSEQQNHMQVGLLACVIRLRTLVGFGMWDHVETAVQDAETVLGLGALFIEAGGSSHTSDLKAKKATVETALTLHVLIMAVTFYTYAGDASGANMRLKVLHALLDAGALTSLGQNGIIEIPFPNSPPLAVQLTHPRTLYVLVFLISSTSKRDPVGRKPKRRVFAMEGVGAIERAEEKLGASVARHGDNSECFAYLPAWASTDDGREVEGVMKRIKADMICELVGLAIARSEHTLATQNLAELVAHTRTHGLFRHYSARVALLRAQMAHAKGRVEEAREWYRVAGFLATGGGESEKDRWVEVAARAGEVWVRIGVLRGGVRELTKDARERRTTMDVDVDAIEQSGDSEDVIGVGGTPVAPGRRGTAREQEREDGQENVEEWEELRKTGMQVVKDCEGMGGNLKAVGEVLKACLSKEYLGSKQHLRRALDLATNAQDNHLRALVLALIAAHYVHTAREHAETILVTCGQIASGLGAPAKKNDLEHDDCGNTEISESRCENTGREEVGNAVLRLWVGERFVDLSRWMGDEKRATRQEEVNRRLRDTVIRTSLMD